VTTHIFTELGVMPHSGGGTTTYRLNARNVLDTGGPHEVSFGGRTEVADPSSACFVNMNVKYETNNGELRTIATVAPVDTSTLSESAGAMWYSPKQLVVDKHYPLANGPQPTSPSGLFDINLVFGGNPLTSKISYECLIEVFDGSPAVVYHP
jgi:hypothetical protein